MQFFLLRRSDLRPSSINGVVGQKWRTSGYHLDELVRTTKSRNWAVYLVHDVFQRVGAVDSETNKDDVGLWVRQRSQSVVLFLPSGIPQSELDHLARWQMRCLGDVVLKYGRHIFLRQSARMNSDGTAVLAYLWEVAGAVADQQTCLSAAAIADDDQLFREARRLGDVRVVCLRCPV
jgi:hypothetical protein